jgi:hypothetical protein
MRTNRTTTAGHRLAWGTLLALGTLVAAVSPAGARTVVTTVRADVPSAIVVDARPFASVEEAANAEARVDWADLETADDAACTESFAATELRAWWTSAAHSDAADVRLVADPTAPEGRLVVYLGRAAARFARDSLAGAALPPLPTTSPDAYRIASLERGTRRVVLVEGASRAGTLYGVYDLIERLGVRFFGPDEEATIVPAAASALPRSLAVSSAPAFAVRGLWAWEPRGTHAFWLWMARRRMNQWTAVERDADYLHKLGMTLTIGGHDLQQQFLAPDSIPPGETRSLRELHADWFGTHGRASGRAADAVAGQNFCTTHPEAAAAFVGGIARAWRDGAWHDADEIVLWMSDAGTWCSCSRCVATGLPTERLLVLASALADTLRTVAENAGRRVPTVSTLAFLETLRSPHAGFAVATLPANLAVTIYPMDRCYAHALDDPACAQTNASFAQAIRAWQEVRRAGMRGPLGLGEYYNIDKNKGLPFTPTAVMARDLRWVHSLGLERFTTMHAPTRLWGPWEWTHLELAALLWDPSTDVAALRDDYVRRAFPTSPASLATVLDRLEFASSATKQLKHRIATPYGPFDLVKQIQAGRSPTPAEPLTWSDAGPGKPGSPGLVARMADARRARLALDAAARGAKTPAERKRVERYLRAAAYLEDTLQFFDAFLRLDWYVVHGRTAEARSELALLEPIATRLRGVVDLVQTGASHSNARDGLEATGVEPELERLRADLAAARARP